MYDKIFDNLYVLYGKESSNTYLLVGNRKVLIDPGIHPEQELLSWIKELGFSPHDINIILLTHCHADHFVDCKFFPKSEIWVSREDGQFLLTKDRFVTVSELFRNNYYPESLQFFSAKQSFDIGSFKLELIALPGHTSGCVGIYDLKREILFSGDVLFKESCGRFDLITSDRKQMKSSLKKLSDLDFKILLPGHGPIYKTTKEDQKAHLKKIITAFL